jgi:hypothetical protein
MIVNTGRARPQADGTYVVPVLNARAEMCGCKVFVQTPDDRTVLILLLAPVEGTAATPYTDWTARTTTLEEPSPMSEPEIITWTATRRLEEGDEPTFIRLVDATHPDAKHIVGGCIGGDAVLARLLYLRGRMVHVVLPADRSKVDPDWRLYCTSYQLMPEGTTYRQRDERMVDLGTRCIGICNRPERHGASIYSGAWMTVRIARAMGRPTEATVLRP